MISLLVVNILSVKPECEVNILNAPEINKILIKILSKHLKNKNAVNRIGKKYEDNKIVINIHLNANIKTDDDFKTICEDINITLNMYNINYYYTKHRYSSIHEHQKIYHKPPEDDLYKTIDYDYIIKNYKEYTKIDTKEEKIKKFLDYLQNNNIDNDEYLNP